jgi:hypothetical protein
METKHCRRLKLVLVFKLRLLSIDSKAWSSSMPSGGCHSQKDWSMPSTNFPRDVGRKKLDGDRTRRNTFTFNLHERERLLGESRE